MLYDFYNFLTSKRYIELLDWVEEILEKYGNVLSENQKIILELIQNKKNQDNVTVILLAKIENNEPKTVLYSESSQSFFDNKNKLVLYIGIATIIVAIGVFAFFFLSGEKHKLAVYKNTDPIETVKVQQTFLQY